MTINKENHNIENKIASLIENAINKKMQNIETDLKQLVIKTSEDHLAKAMQSAIKEILHHITRSATNDMMKSIGLNDSQIMNSLTNKLSD